MNENRVEAARKIWETFKNENKNEQVSKFFHLRPATDIMLITTFPNDKYALTGIKCSQTKRGKNFLSAKLKEINDVLIKSGGTLNDEQMNKLGYNGTQQNNKTREHLFQSNIINMLNNGGAAKDKFEKQLGCDSIQFIASEFVLYTSGDKRKDIPDIIAFNEDMLYILELKVGEPYNGTKGMQEQIMRYKGKYGVGGEKFDKMCKILKIYPMNNINNIANVKFFAVSSLDENNVNNLNVQTMEELLKC